MKSVIYPTLAKRQLFYGIPKDYAAVVVAVLVVCNLLFGNLFIALGIGALLWGLGAWAAKHDPEFVTVLWVKAFKIKRTKGPGRYKGNRYYA
jgi:type IV secretory pathway VirB3-like protein